MNSSGSPGKQIGWIQTLTICSVFLAVLLENRGLASEFFFVESDRTGLILARLFRRIGRLRSMQRVEYSLGDMRSVDGRSLRFEIEETVSRLATDREEELTRWLHATRILGHLNDEKVRLFLRKAIAENIYGAVKTRKIADWHHRRSYPTRGKILLVSSRFVEGLIGKEPGTDIRSCERRIEFLPFRLPLLGCAVAKGCALAFWRGLSSWGSESGPAPKIAVQAADGAEPDRPIDYFWYPRSGIAPRHLLLYFDRPDYPATESLLGKLDRGGIGWAILHSSAKCPWSTMLRAWSPFCPAGVWLAARSSMELAWAGRKGPSEAWGCLVLIHLVWMVASWEGFFRAHHVCAHIHTIDYGAPMVAQAIAAERAGGISIGYHWSHLFFTNVQHSRPQDVFFLWGRHYLPLLVEDHSLSDYLILCGHFSLRATNGSEAVPAKGTEAARKIREELAKAGAEFVVAVFDSSCSPAIHLSRQMVLELYRAFLNELLTDPRLGLVIKPKNPGPLADAFPEISVALGKAADTGRCRVLDYYCAPRLAAGAADIAVGLGINSAAVEAALSGIPAIHCDLPSLRSDRFYSWGSGRIVFDKVDPMMSALRTYRNGGQRDSTLGDHSPVCDAIDPFRDGRTTERIGSFIQDYLLAVIDGRTATVAMEQAAGRYAARCGRDTVIRGTELPAFAEQTC